MKLAKDGYYGGSPEAILAAPLDIVLGMIQYEKFSNTVERAYRELNKGSE